MQGSSLIGLEILIAAKELELKNLEDYDTFELVQDVSFAVICSIVILLGLHLLQFLELFRDAVPCQVDGMVAEFLEFGVEAGVGVVWID